MSESIVELTNDSLILPVLERDRIWAAFALCDLDLPYRERARFIGVTGDGNVSAALLIYSLPRLPALSVYGDEEGVHRLFGQAHRLPHVAYLSLRSVDITAATSCYEFQNPATMLRMGMTVAALSPAQEVEAQICRLSADDLPDLVALYRCWNGATIDATVFHYGVFYGARCDGKLVAVAGTHAVSLRHHIAVIGGVFTHPGYQRRGFATAATNAVAHTLIHQGVRDVVLNVRADNEPAVAVYRRLGFTTHQTFFAGKAVLR
jgi:ribosomal protein S18 acetylase RimI-like enzyme